MNFNSEEEIKHLTDVAKSLASKYGPPEFADDFSQYALEMLFKGRKSTLKQLMIDFKRSEFGDYRHPNGIKRKIAYYDNINATAHPGVEDAHAISFDMMIKGFSGIDRTALVLYYKWSLTLKEIGHSLGVSEALICVTLKEVHAKLNKKYGHA